MGLTGRATTAGVLDDVKRHWTTHRYLEPGNCARIPGLPDVTLQPLGPPRDRKKLWKDNPSKAHSEVTLTDRDLDGRLGLASGAIPVDPEGAPFLAPYCRFTMDEEQQWLTDRYGAQDNAWRQIGADSVARLEELAIKLDSHTNNSSLVLAIELGSGGPVLLFVGDAQVGNWLSWHDVTFDDKESSATVAELLRRTVLYKVGHHGSHNATLRERGLELMTSPDLVALIPVDRKMAVKKKWAMPYGELAGRLEELTAGRVVISDAPDVDGVEGAVVEGLWVDVFVG